MNPTRQERPLRLRRHSTELLPRLARRNRFRRRPERYSSAKHDVRKDGSDADGQPCCNKVLVPLRSKVPLLVLVHSMVPVRVLARNMVPVPVLLRSKARQPVHNNRYHVRGAEQKYRGVRHHCTPDWRGVLKTIRLPPTKRSSHALHQLAVRTRQYRSP
jgi:hypothetical protein